VTNNSMRIFRLPTTRGQQQWAPCSARMACTAVLGLGVVIWGCSGLTHVSAPDVVQPGQVSNAGGAQARRAGAYFAFTTGFGNAALTGGLIGDEFTITFAGTVPEDIRRLPDGQASQYPYGQLSTARVNALLAIQGIRQYPNPNAASQVAELFAWVGTIETLLAENMCAGVRLGIVSGGSVSQGPRLTSLQLYQQARADFDSASHVSGASDSILNYVHLGRGRVLVDLDSLPAAAAEVTGVPTAYLYDATYSTTTAQLNRIAQVVNLFGLTISDREGGNGLDFGSARDPRLPIDSLGLGSDGITPVYSSPLYGSLDSPIVVAGGVEARLIEAEAHLAVGDTTAWLASLNALRADSQDTGIQGLAPLSEPSSDSARVNLTFRERGFWMFGTAHRQGDLRRLIRQYHRDQAAVFPNGPYKGGPTYGTDVTFPVSGEQTTNAPECLDRNA
jgi:hypothetical protein